MFRYQKCILLYSILLLSTLGFAQNIEIKSSVSASAYVSTEEELPFWMVTNKNGALSSKTDGLVQFATEGTYFFHKENNAKLTAGTSLFLRNGVEEKLQRNELYLQFENSWLKVMVGAKNPTDRFQGLSVVDDNFLLSGNARAIPGLLLETAKPILISEAIGVQGGIGHYELNDERVTKNAMIHYKHFGIIVTPSKRHSFLLSIEHYAQWGGTSPEFGKQQTSFKDFINVFFAKNSIDANNDNERLNALGNHLGIYNFEYTYSPAIGSIKIYHQHPFEDGSGTALKNFPDGIWGVYYKPNQEDYTGFLKGFIFEYIQTTNQSGRFGRSGRDNYFNNGIYQTGWRYDINIIGFPFFDNTPIDELIENNRVRGGHVGVLGAVKNVDFLFKVSYTENLGSYTTPIIPTESRVYSFIKSTYNFQKIGSLSLEIGYDFNNERKDKAGAGLTYSYKF
jgi:hypothetical protein|tara:strand:- start:34134 stop:35486 length:1353 start_codon:yes stop_codon:yes gene_type:complete